MKNNRVILVDEQDRPIGHEEKMQAHRDGKLHRAFSVFVFYREGDTLTLLLQQRQHSKYHCGGLWTNTCCSHPQPNEETLAAGQRRLLEELGMRVPLTAVGEFTYLAHFDNGLIEHEYDHVLVGFTDSKTVSINPQEVAEIAWVDVRTLADDLQQNPAKYTPWFEPALKIALRYVET